MVSISDKDFKEMINKMYDDGRITQYEKDAIMYKADIDNDYMCGDPYAGFWD